MKQCNICGIHMDVREKVCPRCGNNPDWPSESLIVRRHPFPVVKEEKKWLNI